VRWIDQARNLIRIYYEHTSHGSQIITGLEVIQTNLGSPYIFNYSGSGGALSIHDIWNGDLGHNGDLTWESTTRNILNQPGNTRNMVMWSWCGGVSDNSAGGINTYLNAMNQLEKDYPGVTFIYMTGHLDGTGETGNLHVRNNQIRNYCTSNNKILFDFADIESFDPDSNYFLDQNANDECYYDSGNWAKEWCAANSGSELCSTCECAHSQPLNCNLKGRAFWWMMARLVGWDGVSEEPDSGYSASPSSLSFGQVLTGNSRLDTLTITNTGNVSVTIDSLTTSNDVFTLSNLIVKSCFNLSGFTLNVGESREVLITFSPVSIQKYSATLTIYSSQTENRTIALSGEGFVLPEGGFHVTGNVSGTWSSYDTVFVDGDINVPYDKTLQINPVTGGTTILFTGHYKFNVYGRLLLRGTKTDSVFLTSLNKGTGWYGLRFFDLNSNGLDSSFVSYARFEYGNANGGNWEDQRGGAIFLSESSPVLKNLFIVNNSAVESGGGLFCSYGSSPVVSDVIFSNNTAQEEGGGIYCMDDIHPSFLRITVTGNLASSGGGISCGSHNAIFKEITVKRNRANGVDASGGGILCNANFLLTSADISNNTCTNNGGGFACNYENSPTLTNVTIMGNSADEVGGGLSCFYSSSPKLTNVTISGNTAGGDGGGISCQYDSNPVLYNVTIKDNSAGGEGGGVSLNIASPILKNVTLFGNTADSRGGAIAVIDSSNAIFQNCLICNNNAEWGGGIIFLYNHGTPRLINLTIVHNKASISGGGVAFDWGNPIIRNTIIWNNHAQNQGDQVYLHVENADPHFYYCNIQNGSSGFGGSGAGSQYTNNRYQNNMESYPQFEDSSNFRFQLAEVSPCIDSGDPDTTGLHLPFYDLSGQSRICDGRIDIGCYEWQSSVDVDHDFKGLPNVFRVYHNFPNPFNPMTTIRFTLPRSQLVWIYIYDITGNEVSLLLNEEIPAGEHKVVFNGSSLTSGIYIYQIKTPEHQYVNKMILIK
jgi:predicted outer membrane repeat protein